jgi:hypothetical protein
MADSSWDRYPIAKPSPLVNDPWAKYPADTPSIEYDIEGAPVGVRAKHGLARRRERLESLRQDFPDVVETADGNFVYTDPKTRRKVLYNEPGLSLGDVASVGRPVAETVGGIVGAIPGMAAGGPVGAAATAGIGTAAAGAGVDLARKLTGQPHEFSGQDVAGDVTAGAGGELGGQAFNKFVVRPVARAVTRPGAQATVAAARTAGTPVTAAQTMRGPFASGEFAAAEVLPFSKAARVQNKLYDKATGMLEAAQPQPARPPANLEEAKVFAGTAMKEAAERATKTHAANLNKIDSVFYGRLPPGAAIPMPNLQRSAAALRAAMARDPGFGASLRKEGLEIVEGLEKTLAYHGGKLPLDIVRSMRTEVGKLASFKSPTAAPSEVKDRLLQDVYGALKKDLYAGATSYGPKAERALARHDRLVKAFRGEDLNKESIAGSLESILKGNSDEQAWIAFNSGSGGINRMRQLVQKMSPEEKKIVARATWERMTTTPQGNSRPSAGWATQWLATTPEQKHLLFGNMMDVSKLDALAKVLREQAEGAARFSNVSKSGYELQRLGAAKAVGKAALGTLAGSGAAAAGLGPQAIGLGTLAYAIPELIYSPKLLTTLIEALGAAPSKSGPVSRFAGQTAAQYAESKLPPKRRDLLGGP